MNLQDAFYRTVHDYPGGCESLAPRMGMSPAVLRNKANPNSTCNLPSLADADRVIALTGNTILLHALCASHGHVAVRVEAEGHAGDLAVLDLIARVWSAQGDVGQAVKKTLADHRVEARELRTVRASIYRAQQAMLDMLAGLEEMAEPEGGQ